MSIAPLGWLADWLAGPQSSHSFSLAAPLPPPDGEKIVTDEPGIWLGTMSGVCVWSLDPRILEGSGLASA